MKPHGRYGFPVLRTPTGTWYWNEFFQTIDYVQKGKQVSEFTVPILKVFNDLNGAVRRAAKEEFQKRTVKNS